MIYAIGDIHAIMSVTEKLYNEILEDIKQVNNNYNTIIFLGDFIDRGDYSKDVLDFLMNLKDTDQIKHIFLWGNHEDMMSSVIDGDNSMIKCWLQNGGIQTLESFGLYDRNSNPNEFYVDFDQLKPYNDWFKENLKLYYETEDYIFCHSGFFRTDFNIPLNAQKTNLLWGRPHAGIYIGYGKTVIHGHTPTHNEIPSDEPYRICVDVGCGKFNDSLACVVLPNSTKDYIPHRYIQVYGDSGNKSFI